MLNFGEKCAEARADTLRLESEARVKEADESTRLTSRNTDLEGLAIENEQLEQKFDDENMKHAIDKLNKKNSGGKSLILSDKEVSDQRKVKAQRRVNIKRGDDEQDICGKDSRTVQSWSNVPRFHMERMFSKSDKDKRKEKVDLRLKRTN